MPDCDLWRLDSIHDYQEMLAWLVPVLDSGRPISLDLETESIKEQHSWGRGYTRLFQIGTDEGGWAIDARDHHAFVGHVIDLVRQATNPVIYANMKFEQHAFLTEGWGAIPWHRCEDVVAMHRLVRSEQQQHGLKPASGEELGSWATEGQDILRKVFRDEGLSWGTIPTTRHEYWAYGIIDTCLTVMLYNSLLPETPEFYQVEQEYQRLTHGWERTGLLLDPPAVHFADSVWTAKIDSLLQPLHDLGFKKPGSSTAVRDAFKALGHEPEHYSQTTGDPKYDKMVLKLLQSMGGDIASAAELLVEFRRATTWRNNYGVKLLRFADGNNRIHPSILTSQARTTRSSIVEPPLQTLPKGEITRNMFLPSLARKLWAVDYSSQEIRIMAAMSGDKALIEFFMGDSEESDYHQYVANLAQIPRDTAKTISYARPYGAGTPTMARTAGCSPDQMEIYLRQLDAKFPHIPIWLSANTRAAEALTESQGWPSVDLPYGITIALEAGSEHTQASNSLIQGHGATVLKLACARLAAAGFEDYMILTVHDEILFDVPEDVDGAALMVEAAEIMRDDKLRVPLTCDITGPLDRWGQAYKKETK